MKKIMIPAFLLAGVVAVSAATASAHGWFGLGRDATPEEVAEKQTQMFQHQAETLGISVDAVKQGWAEGKTLGELAEANGISEDELQAKMKEQAKQRMTEHMQSLVSQGVITQAQADQRLKIMQERMETAPMGKGMGRHGGMGMGMMGMGRGF